MPSAVGIKLSLESFPRFFKPTVEGLEPCDFCIVADPDSGAELIGMIDGFEGRCPVQWEGLPSIVRRASDDEIARWYENNIRQRDALAQARARVQLHNLPMKLTEVRFDDAQNLVTFYFTADHRIDFRELVRDLASIFKSRIELWQIGTRREAAAKDGFGPCGLRLCCAAWMRQQPAVSIRHARAQDLAQTPPKLSGTCGRLRCCLRFEHESYCLLAATAPAVGGRVRDAGMEGVVVDRNLLAGRALVRFGEAAPQWIPFGRLELIDPPKVPRCAGETAAAAEHGAENAAENPDLDEPIPDGEE
jgi:cell fate regulator YaaT (PSP1 superfamily)